MSIALDRSESPSPGDHEPLTESSPIQQREAPLRRRQTIAGSHSSESFERPPAIDSELHATLERLQAAEWHVRHRQESMGKTSFRQLIADHSAQAAARRLSTRTSSMCSNNQGESTALSRCSSATSVHASAVADLPRPSALAMQSTDGDVLEPRKKSKTPTARKKRKGKSAKNGAPSSFTKTSAPPLSSLLRMEVGAADAAGRSRRVGSKSGRLQAARSTDLLIEKVARTEAKRKQVGTRRNRRSRVFPSCSLGCRSGGQLARPARARGARRGQAATRAAAERAVSGLLSSWRCLMSVGSRLGLYQIT